MVVVTGGAGFVGSNIIAKLAEAGIEDILVADRLTEDNWRNLCGKQILDYVDKDALLAEVSKVDIDVIIHMGARTDTLDLSSHDIMQDNFEYSKELWKWCAAHGTRFVFASSASVYGSGEDGFKEDVDISHVRPLNPYAFSKWLFDIWASRQSISPPEWAGLRFFNVYGPGEGHKGRMASMVLQSYNQISENGYLQLFKSRRSKYENGGQMRDFVHVFDVASVVTYMATQPLTPGVYNVGSGQARTFNDLANAVFYAMKRKPDIRYIDMPEGLDRRYQYYTEASLDKLRSHGYKEPFLSLEDGVRDYIGRLQTGGDD